MQARRNRKTQIDTLPNQPDRDDLETSQVIAPTTAPTGDIKPQRRGRRIAWLIVIGGLIVYMVIVPSVVQLLAAMQKPTQSSRVLTDMTFAEQMRLHSVSGIVMLMFLAMGASIGSFLNVVIFRLPRGKPLLWPPSSCASCGERIKGKDNIPIFAWLFLGGRCRGCQQPISVRYPIVEATVAAYFVLFYYLELLSGGGNLPVRTQNFYRGIVWILLYTKWDLVSIYLLHMFVLTVLLAWGMINWDRFAVPWRSCLKTLALVLTLIAFSPHLNEAYAAMGAPKPGRFLMLYLGSVGCIAGAGLGQLLRQLFPMTTPPLDEPLEPAANSELPEDEPSTSPEEALQVPQDGQPIVPIKPIVGDRYGSIASQPVTLTSSVASLALLGTTCGPSLVLAVTAISCLGMLILKFISPMYRSCRRIPMTIVIWAVAVIYLSCWLQIERNSPAWWPKASSSILALTVTAAVEVAVISLALIVRRLTQFDSERVSKGISDI